MTTPTQKHAQRNRGTIFVEDGEILSRDAFPGDQFVQRIRAPKCAAHARAGSFVHITCDPMLPMRRPMSIMRVQDDWFEILYKTHGEGLSLLAEKEPGSIVSVLGPIGQPFNPDPHKPNCLLIGGGVGIPPMVYLADVLRTDDRYRPLAILGSEIPFPFDLIESKLDFDGVDDAIRATMPLLESWDIPTRLTTLQGYEGCYDGYVTDLADRWLSSQDAELRAATKIFTCGPTPMLRAVAELAARHDVACEVSLEEYMACAVGGCAGCTVLVDTPDGQAMKRVCVDGPVFDAAIIAW
ncbi:MAG: dihydroorotate dehydrogenase electron transfer subunit [Woeseiaceae bacterium]|nr:dihydroorotate dehydrogenase electron transfer subunit [Woeseiaceae bacterium]